MSKMINCKSCNSEISSDAKACPSCGAKNKKPFYKKIWFWIIVAILLISTISNLGSNDSAKKTSSSSTKAEETVFEIGDVITTDKFDISIKTISTRTTVGNEYFSTTPSEGGIFVVVEWDCKNISDQAVSSFSCPSINLVDANGNKYNSDIDATSYYATETELDRKILSDLNPGINVKDAQVFEISEEMWNNGGFSVFVNADKDFNVKAN